MKLISSINVLCLSIEQFTLFGVRQVRSSLDLVDFLPRSPAIVRIYGAMSVAANLPEAVDTFHHAVSHSCIAMKQPLSVRNIMSVCTR